MMCIYAQFLFVVLFLPLYVPVIAFSGVHVKSHLTFPCTRLATAPNWVEPNVVYKFSRPHTIKGTILASTMAVTRALAENRHKFSTTLVPKAVLGLFALLCGNSYIVGINQIYDVEIDEINKPYLPIVAKLLSKQNAWQITLLGLITGTGIVKANFSRLIFTLYVLGLGLGTAYSVPPIQFKRSPALAALIIATVRGFLLNFGVYYACREALGVPFRWNPVVVFISAFMTVFASVIAVTKDLSDVAGDKQFRISTFASHYGVARTAAVATAALCVAYVIAGTLPWLAPKWSFRPIPMLLGHLSGLLYLLRSYTELDADDHKSINRFYKAIWNLFYFEYVLYPFI